MENNGNILVDEQVQDVHKKNLVRRERIGKTFGSGYMRTIAILLTIFVSIDLFAGFVTITTCDRQIFFQSISWISLVVTRFLPNIICCIAVWAIFSTAHSKHEINLTGFKALRIIIIILAIVTIFHLIGGIVMFALNTNFVRPIDSFSTPGTVILSMVVFAIFKLVVLLVYVFMFISVNSLVKGQDGEKPMMLGKTTSIILVVVGSLMVLNFVPIFNIIDEIVRAFDLTSVNVYQVISFIYQNPISIILGGIIMIFTGIVILLFNNRKQIEK